MSNGITNSNQNLAQIYDVTLTVRAAGRPIYTGPTAVDLARIPAGLKARPQWVLWRGEDRLDTRTGNVKLNKIPIDPQTLNKASTTDPTTWGTFEQCVNALDTALEGWDAYR